METTLATFGAPIGCRFDKEARQLRVTAFVIKTRREETPSGGLLAKAASADHQLRILECLDHDEPMPGDLDALGATQDEVLVLVFASHPDSAPIDPQAGVPSRLIEAEQLSTAQEEVLSWIGSSDRVPHGAPPRGPIRGFNRGPGALERRKSWRPASAATGSGRSSWRLPV